MYFVRVVIVFAFSFALCAEAQNVPDSEVLHPNQRITVANLALTSASDSSASGIARAAVAIVLSSSKVKCDSASQVESVIDANAESSLGTFVSKIAGASCAMDGRTMRVSALFSPNGAIKANDLVASIKLGKPLLMKWKGTLYVLYGVVYDEHLFNSGRQDNVIRELLLIEPRYQDRKRFVTFSPVKNDFGEVEGWRASVLTSVDGSTCR